MSTTEANATVTPPLSQAVGYVVVVVIGLVIAAGNLAPYVNFETEKLTEVFPKSWCLSRES